MKFIIRNQAQIANKYLRFAKWKIRKLSSKYGQILYSDIFVKKIAHKPALYEVTIKLGIPGPDIIVSAKAQNLNTLWAQLSSRMKRQLRKNYEQKNSYVNQLNTSI